MVYEKCRGILLKEFELIQTALVIQEKIRIAVSDRQWTVFEEILSAINGIEAKLNELEAEREKLFNVSNALLHQQNFSDNLDSRGCFFALTAMLPEDQRYDLTSIYRSLKLEAVKLKIENESLCVYLNGIKSTLREFFDLAFTERGGKMYTKEGTHFSHDLSSMVLNRSF